MKIVNIQYIGPKNDRTCIMDTGISIPASIIKGEAAVTRTVEYIDNQYIVTSGAAVPCEI